ncbi:hypothetical protein ZWY2020_046791 [Hordeum vulgare]|nr:hypothetical protein ZWY2020_046791 [Hordeum vulgare]
MYGLEVSSNKQAKNNVSACCQLDAYLFRSIKKRSHGMEGHPSSIIGSQGVAPFFMLAGHPSSIYWVP